MMILGWFWQLGHGLICMWRGGQAVEISEGPKPQGMKLVILSCTCGKVFWEAEKQPKEGP